MYEVRHSEPCAEPCAELDSVSIQYRLGNAGIHLNHDVYEELIMDSASGLPAARQVRNDIIGCKSSCQVQLPIIGSIVIPAKAGIHVGLYL